MGLSGNGGNLVDPMQHLHLQKSDHSGSAPQSSYNPSVNEKVGRRGGGGGGGGKSK